MHDNRRDASELLSYVLRSGPPPPRTEHLQLAERIWADRRDPKQATRGGGSDGADGSDDGGDGDGGGDDDDKDDGDGGGDGPQVRVGNCAPPPFLESRARLLGTSENSGGSFY